MIALQIFPIFKIPKWVELSMFLESRLWGILLGRGGFPKQYGSISPCYGLLPKAQLMRPSEVWQKWQKSKRGQILWPTLTTNHHTEQCGKWLTKRFWLSHHLLLSFKPSKLWRALPPSLPPEFKSKVTHKIRLSMKLSILFSLLSNIFMFLVLRNLKLYWILL